MYYNTTVTLKIKYNEASRPPRASIYIFIVHTVTRKPPRPAPWPACALILTYPDRTLYKCGRDFIPDGEFLYKWAREQGELGDGRGTRNEW